MRWIVLACCTFTSVVGCGGGDLAGPSGSQDQDTDGVLDADDRCPSQAETANQWKDEDGCPDTTDELYQFARTDIEKYWQSTFTANNGSYALIQVFQGYEAQISTACGPSVPDNAFYCRTDHGIYYHVSFLNGFLEVGAYAPHFIIAHEFGHSVQNQLGFTRDLYSTVLRELQADCFGGAYTRDAQARGILEEGAIEAAVLSLFRVGDPLGTWFDPAGHGSAGQRIDAFTVGVERGPLACVSLLSPPPPPPPPGAASTTTTIMSDSPDPSGVGQSVTVTVRVASASGTPTGSVGVNVLGGTESCSGILSNGSVTCTLVLSREGTGTLIASYTGNSSFAPSSGTEAHTVQALPGAVEKVSGDGQSGAPSSELANPLVVRVLDSQNNPVAGRAVTWLAATGSASPETSTTDVNGEASTEWTLGPTPGANSLTAVVSGVGNATFNATGIKVASATTITSHQAEPSLVGTAVNVGVTVDGAGGIPSGQVTVSGDGAVASCTITLANGSGSCSITFTQPGNRDLTATYAGDARFSGSSVTVKHQVSPAPNGAPVAANDTYTATEDQPLVVNAAQGVLSNDSDPEGGPLTAVNASDPARGSVQLNTDGSFTYTPDPDLAGPDQFTYSARDTQGSTTSATVTVNVGAVNDPPTGATFVPPPCSVGEECRFEAQVFDPDQGDVLTYDWDFGDGTPHGTGSSAPHTYQSVPSDPEGYTVTLVVTDSAGETSTHSDKVPVNP